MSTIVSPGSVRSEQTVVNCYDFFERLFPASGLSDLTDGIYDGDESLSYEEAQERQADWLLDQVGCGPGSRILDIGCGNGRILAAAKRRGAEAIGITISPPQVERCRSKGLDARLLNYRNIGDEWNGRFDGIIANGSMEHFVQPKDMIAGEADNIYRELFSICSRLLDPASPARRMATTVIHFHEKSHSPPAEDLLKSPFSFPWKSREFHLTAVQRGFGGSYPQLGQLESCASPKFRLIEEVDGTEDYRITSDANFEVVRKNLFSLRGALGVWPRMLLFLGRHPRQGGILLGILASGSWRWQFHGNPPPTRLLRHVWQCESA